MPTSHHRTIPTDEQGQSAAKLKLAFSVAGIGMSSIDVAAGTITLDDISAEVFQLPANSPLPRSTVHARIHPDCAIELKALLEKAIDPRGDGFLAIEHKVCRPDGTIVWVAARKQFFFDAPVPGKPARAILGLVAISEITQQKLAEHKLRVSEVRYRRLFEAAHEGVLLLDPATAKIVDANPFMTNLLGYSHAGLVGKELYEIGLLKDETASKDMFNRLRIMHQVRYEDLPLKTQTGRNREVEVVANLYDEDGHSIIQCNIRDITDRRANELAALQNTKLFSTLIEEAPTGVYVIDEAFKMAQINRLALPAFTPMAPLRGHDFSEILRTTWGPEVGSQIEKQFRHTLTTGERFVSAPFTETRHDTGIKQSYDWELQRVTMGDGTFGVACYFNDITERRIAENIVAEREAHVRSILDNTQALIGLLSVDGTILEVNAPAVKAAHLSRKRVVGQKIWDPVFWTHEPEASARLQDAVRRAASGEIVRYDLVVVTGDKRRVDIDFMLAPVLDAAGNITLLVPSGLDITERKLSLHHIQQLMGEVNHRAMNLLGVVQAVARQTAREGDPKTFVLRLTERIGGLAASQDLLVQNEWQGVNLQDLAKAQLAHYKGLFGTNVVFHGPRVRLSAHAAQGIGMALHELGTNAGKYGALSGSNGLVHITWRIVTLDIPRLEIEWLETGGPEVLSPTRKGFGQKVIGPMVEAATGGHSTIEYRASGIRWTLAAPVTRTLEGGRLDTSTPDDRPK